MENENDERIVSDGSAKQGGPDNLPLAPGERKALLASLDAAEGMIKNDTGRETAVLFDREGRGVFVKRANGTFVSIKAEVIQAGERAIGGTFTHSHPRSTSFTYDDLETCCWAKFGELRVSSRLYKYSIRAVDGNLSSEIFEKIEPLYAGMSAALRREMDATGGYPDSDEFEREFSHHLWERLAPQAGLVYHREDQKKPRITLT